MPSDLVVKAGAELAAALATGVAVKLMDDALDDSTPATTGNIAYALLFLSLGAVFQPAWAATLFLASYAAGMAFSGHPILPSRLPAWLESVLAVGVGLAYAGAAEMIAALAAIVLVQAVDHWVDRDLDRARGRVDNWVLQLGVWPAALLALTAFSAGVLCSPWKLGAVAVAAALVSRWAPDQAQIPGEEEIRWC